ncbi:MAG TPA: amidohydrolase family protein, partial [Pyrinomonadaceae bacterium]|nr:amidohydrolase family protein [Pyrinomonadaceae bacterium]
TYAITNARIFTLSGPVIERGTIVIRNGLISAVGANVTAPADARLIDGAGLNIYPGLIDANTNLAVPAQVAPQQGGRPGAGGQASQQAANFTSPNSTQPPGLQPEILAADIIRPGGDQIEAARNAGITAALTSPRDGIFMGQSALINLAGDTPQQMIVRSPVALHIGFTPLRTGGYPGSIMGVFSAIRQMLLDAQRYRTSQEIYARNPRGLRRPDIDKSLAALLPALAREMPVVMTADSEREIIRALDLAREFNLKAIIAGGLESWKVADRLREQDVPVLLSLNFPKRTTADSPEADPEPTRVLRQRVEAPRGAGRLAAARVRFAFQSGQMGNMSDFLANAAKAVQNGLAHDEALRAMTVYPAEIIGVADRMGTIEVGKIANLTVSRGDILERSSRITNVFIDGRPVDLRPAATAAAQGGANASGNWSINIRTEEGRDVSITLNLQQQGERLSGSIQGGAGSAPIANASIGASGDIRFTTSLTIDGQTVEGNFTGTITGNQMRGTVQIVGRGPATFTGTRAGGGTPTAQQPNQPPATGTAVETPNIAGTWSISFAFPDRAVPATLTLQQQGTSVTGSAQSDFGTSELNGSVGADGFRLTTHAVVNGQTVEIILIGTVTGSEMRGTLSSAQLGSAPFTGTKNP